MSETSENRTAGLVAALPGDDASTDQRPVTRPPDRRHRRRWVPVTAAWLCLLIGLADIAQVVMPSFYQRTHLHKINSYVPGTLTNLTRTVDVLIGLMLLMLSHGLRRRKRRAWEAATLLLAFSIVVHLARLPHVVPAVAAAGVLAALLYFRDEFYAVGGARGLRRARGGRCGHRSHLHAARPGTGPRLLLRAAHPACDLRPGRHLGTGPVSPGQPQRPVQSADQRPRPVHPGGGRLPVPAPGQAD